MKRIVGQREKLITSISLFTQCLHFSAKSSRNTGSFGKGTSGYDRFLSKTAEHIYKLMPSIFEIFAGLRTIKTVGYFTVLLLHFLPHCIPSRQHVGYIL